MPLIKRQVEPTHLSRGVVSDRITNELECVTNNTLAGVIRQLSSLGRHAEDIFGELYNEAHSLFERSNNLQSRIDKLSDKVTKLDSSVEEVSLQDINMRKAFKSSVLTDQQVVSRSSIPSAMNEIYNQCDKPPALNNLSKYRDDGKEGLKFYTDPTYFFELWCQDIKEQTEKIKREKKKKQRRPVASRDPGKIRRPNVRVYDNMKDGAELSQTSGPPSIASSGTPSRPMSIDFPSDGSSAHGSSPNLQQADEENDYRVSLVNRQRSINSNAHRPKPSAAPPAPPMNNHTGMGAPPPPPPPPPPMYPGPTQNFNHAHMNNTFPASHVSMDDLPPPPPPNGVAVDISNTQKPVSVTGSVPPPPPPPPPPGPLTGNIPPAPPPPSLNQEVKQPLSPSPDTGSPAKTQPKGDGRSDLLFAIREGIQLRKVQVQEENDRKQSVAVNTVEAILARRIAVEISSDEESDEFDDEDWS